MANPYHDETGKFCSRGEMQTAIERLADAQDLDGYFRLREEFNLIDQNKVVVSKELLSAYANSGIILHDKAINNAEDITQVYEAISKVNNHSLSGQAAQIESLLANPNTPQEVKDDILIRSSLNVKRELADYIASDKSDLVDSDIFKFVKNETDPKVLLPFLFSAKLTFEDRFNLAKRYEPGLSDLASYQPQIFSREPKLQEELLLHTKKLVDGNSRFANTYLETLGQHSQDEQTLNYVVDKANLENLDNAHPYVSLAYNSALSVDQTIRMLGNINKRNVRAGGNSIREAIGRTLGAKINEPTPRNHLFSAVLNSMGTKLPRKKGSPAPIDPDFYEDQSEEIIRNRKISLQAREDSYEDNWKTLESTLKKLQKVDPRKRSVDQRASIIEIESRFFNAKENLRNDHLIAFLQRFSSNS